METDTSGRKWYSLLDVRCDCQQTGGCNKCQKEVEQLNNNFFVAEDK